MDNTRLEFLFKRYLDGRATAQETDELIEFITKNDNQQLKSLLEEVWNTPTEQISTERAEKIFHSIISEQKNITPLHRRRRMFPWVKVAAAVSIVACSLGALYVTFFQQHDVDQSIAVASASQHQIIQLPDGSTVKLNASSALEYPASFDDQPTRLVRLTGEGFFDIVHDSNRPFIVQTGTVTTTVLGTAFNVKAYPNENDITITVTRGKVKVSESSLLLGVLSPDEQITFNKGNRQAKQQNVESKAVTSWAESDLFFDDISIADAARQLEERFHIKIGFANDAVKKCRFTATFVSEEDAHQILKVICEFNGASYSISPEGDIKIDGPGCSE